MASTYVNDLRLEEIGSGEQSGTWGDTTNTNLELIAEAFSFGTEAITTNADTHTTTIADGATDPGRSMFLKYTGTLDSACTITIGPNTVSKLWFIENGTSGSQNIIISQGSGANITIPPGDTKAIYSDGAGSGAAMVDAFASLNVGSFTSNAASTITTADNTTQLTLISTDADALVGPQLDLYRNSASPADNDILGVITFNGEDSAGNKESYASFTAYATDVTSGTEDATFYMNTTVAGAETNRITLHPSETVFNEEGKDIDFRIETDAQPSAFVLDAANDTLTITNVPTEITHSGNGYQLKLTSTDADASKGPVLELYRNSASPADVDELGNIHFTGRNDNSQDVTYGEIEVYAMDVSDGSEDGLLNINTVVGGTGTSRIKAITTETVINDDSADLDFRVESNGNANMLFVDGGNNHVNIGGSGDLGGILNVTGDASVQIHSTDRHLMSLVSTEAGASDGPRLILQRNSSSPADNDQLGILEFYGENDADEATEYARINAAILDASDGTEDGSLGINTRLGGANASRMYMSSTETVFNEQSYDLDFRIESNDNTHALFVDGGNSHVCLNTATDHGAVLNIETTGNAVNLTLACTDTDTGEGPIMDFTRDAGNVPGDGDLMGVIRFRNDNTNLEMINYATISSTVTDVTDGTEDGKLTFKAMHGGTLTEFLRLEGTSNGIVFNDDRALLDFRVASGANNHMLFVDASQNTVSVGNSTANYAFHVNENRAGNYVAGITNDGNNVDRYGMIFKIGTDDGSGTNTYIAFDDGDGSGVGAITGSGGTITYATFTAVHPAILPDADNEDGYAYGTLLDTTEITYSKRKNGQETERGIRYKVVKSASANSRKVLGAYAGKDPKYNNEHLVNVLGDGHILCNNSGGNIDVGDGICTSATAGIGQKATASPSMIIGIAQEAVTFSGTETKLVPVQYGLQQFTPWS